jgi:hypothetical protein
MSVLSGGCFFFLFPTFYVGSTFKRDLHSGLCLVARFRPPIGISHRLLAFACRTLASDTCFTTRINTVYRSSTTSHRHHHDPCGGGAHKCNTATSRLD